MSDPKRLVQNRDLGGKLLASARVDTPSRRARERTAAALGVSIAVTGAASGAAASGAAGAGTSGVGSSGVGAAMKLLATTTWTKVVAAGVVTVALGGGVVVVNSRLAPDTATSASRIETSTAASTRLPRASAPAMIASPPSLVSDPTTAASAPAAIATVAFVEHASAPSATAKDTATSTTASARPDPSAVRINVERHAPAGLESGPSSSSTANAPAQSAIAPVPEPAVEAVIESALTRELRSLDEARAALHRGDASAALIALDRHEQTFPRGAMQTEASILRVEALLASGDATAARALARALLARDPAGPHARRLTSIVDGPGP